MSLKVKRYVLILFAALMLFGSQLACVDDDYKGRPGDVLGLTCAIDPNQPACK